MKQSFVSVAFDNRDDVKHPTNGAEACASASSSGLHASRYHEFVSVSLQSSGSENENPSASKAVPAKSDWVRFSKDRAYADAAAPAQSLGASWWIAQVLRLPASRRSGWVVAQALEEYKHE